jgi:glucose/arabinose dehydrogenase
VYFVLQTYLDFRAQIKDTMKRLGIILFQLLLCLNLALTQDIDGQLPFEITLEQFATGFSSPVDIVHAGDSRLFVVERSGRIKILNSDGTTNSTPFLDIDDRVINTGGQSERGLLALAFHPDYVNNGYFFVHYSDNNGDTAISRFEVDPNDENLALPDSEVIIYTASQPFANHNGGSIHFGPRDGMLYIGLGDGGSANDPQNLAQNPMSPMGKMLRIDVDSGLPYTIPADNPFVSDPDVLNEIWALGLRNPWKWTFDKVTGDMWIGDVGQGAWEEVNMQPADSEGGENYGWRCREGAHNAITTGCNGEYDEPVGEYNHQGFTHCSITGGYVYRGDNDLLNDAPPVYFSVDYCSGAFFAVYREPLASDDFRTVELVTPDRYPITTFGEDLDGELYVARFNNGRIYKVVPVCNLDNMEIFADAASCEEAADGRISLDQSEAIYFDLSVIDLASGSAVDAQSLPPGDYEVTISRFGCSYTRAVEVLLIERAPVDLAFDATSSTLMVSSSGVAYEWFLDDVLLPGLTTQSIEISESGNYSVIVTEASGCVLPSEPIFITISDVNTISSIDTWELSPNPVQDIFTMTLGVKSAQVFSLRVLDTTGKEIKSSSIDVGGQSTHTIDLSNYAEGVYIIMLSDGDSTQSKRIVKQ